jgi:hypothetical protein
MHDTSAFARIDFIMGGSTRGWSVPFPPVMREHSFRLTSRVGFCYRRACSYRIGQSLYDDGMYESDHRPVFADVQIT